MINLINKVLEDYVNFLPADDMRDLASAGTSSIVQQRLQFHRLEKKFERPSSDNDSLLHDRCLATFLSTEGRINDKWNSSETTEWIRGNPNLLRRIRLEITKILSHFRFSYEDCKFGGGETFISSGGLTSHFDKWCTADLTCTRGAFDLFAKVLYSNRSYRRVVWLKCASRRKCNHELYKTSRDYRFAYFKAHLRSIVKFVPGSRFSSVYKNREARRPICIEAAGALMLQKGVGSGLKVALSLSGNNTWTGQADHALLIEQSRFSTIDFSNASDSIHNEWVKLLFPDWFNDLIQPLRARFVVIDDVSYRLNKVSSMGNGFTWELMTVLLLAVARSINAHETRVYGDDVVIVNEHAHQFVTICEHLGFEVNVEKSFIAHDFKESCGAFTHDGHQLKSFDFKWVHNELQARSTMNKLQILGRTNHVFKFLHDKLIRHVPKDELGLVPSDDVQHDYMDTYYWCEDLPATKVNSGIRWIAEAYCYNPEDIYKVSTFQPDKVELALPDGKLSRHVEYMLRLSHLRKSGASRTVRHDDDNLPLKKVTLYVHREQGVIMSSRHYKNLRNDLTDYLLNLFEVDRLGKEHWDIYLPSRDPSPG